MISPSRRRVLVAVAASGVLGRMTETEPAHADPFGGDLALLAGILGQSIAQAITMSNLLVQTVNQVKMMTTLLKAVESGSFPALINFINTARYSYNSLTYGLASMSYRMAQIDREFQQLFPPDAPPPGTTVAQHRAQYQAWNQEIVGASQIATRQQTTLALLDDHATKTQTILQESEGESGVVGQLQLIAQLLGIANAELVVMNQTLSTTSRVLTDMAAQGASERQLSSTKKDDSRTGYTDKGLPVAVPSTLP